jgi:hypothetical protein
LQEHFSPAEVVELVFFVANMLGQHRMFSVFKVIGEHQPVISFDPQLVDLPASHIYREKVV